MAYDRIQRGYKRGSNKGMLVMAAIIVLLLAAIIVLLIVGSPLQNGEADLPSSSAPPVTSQGPTEEEQALMAEADQWYLKLVNKDNVLTGDHNPERTVINERYNPSGLEFDSRAVDALNQMCADAEADGVSLVVISAYRSISKQRSLYDNKVDRLMAQGQSREDALVNAAAEVAYPGTSEHNTGLAADIVSETWFSTHDDLTEDFDQTPEFAWLSQNAYKYGFILRYPKDKEDITEITYEPWHYRYVGIENAKKIKDSGLCLEEYLSQQK